MQAGSGVGIGVKLAAGAVAATGIALMIAARHNDSGREETDEAGEPTVTPALAPRRDDTSWGDDPIDDGSGYPTGPVGPVYPGPGGGTSGGDDAVRMPVSGHIDPPGWFDDYTFDGTLDRGRLDVIVDPRGWFNDIEVDGRVSDTSWDVDIDPPGWGNTTRVDGHRTSWGSYDGTVDRPGIFNDVEHRITETVRGTQLIREGRFDERFVPGWSEATWRSAPTNTGDGARLLEFDPPGWGNTTRVTLDGAPPAGVEAAVAAHLFDAWRTEQERQAEYPDPGYPDPTGPGDDYDYPTGPGDDGYYPY